METLKGVEPSQIGTRRADLLIKWN